MTESLPTDLPIFPLPRAIVLPRVNLPLNIFEPRYFAMIDHALKTDRMIGMIQTYDGQLLKTGCAARIAAFEETEDNRYLVTLRGVARFTVKEELPLHAGGFRHIVPDWSKYPNDLTEDTTADTCRDKITALLRRYFEKMKIDCDQWARMHDMPCEILISTLSVICPFTITEKQALLESPNLEHRIRMLHNFLETAILRAEEQAVTTCH